MRLTILVCIFLEWYLEKGCGLKLNNSYVIGLDLAILNTGVAVLACDWKPYDAAVYTGVIKSQTIDCSRLEMYRRYYRIADSILVLVDTYGGNVAIGGYSYGMAKSKKSSIVQMAEIGGTVRAALARRNIVAQSVAPLHARRVIS